MSGSYEMFHGKDGQYYFRLKAANGEIILSGEGYATKAGCENGIRAVQGNCQELSRYALLTASDGSPYFTLKAANHQIIGQSQRYRTVQARDEGVASVMRNGQTTRIVDLSAS